MTNTQGDEGLSGMKQCSRCHKLKPETSFYRNGRAGSERRHSHCSTCVMDAQRERRSRDKVSWVIGLSVIQIQQALSWSKP